MIPFRSLFSLCAVSLCLSTAVAQQNVLPDPGFEAPEHKSDKLTDGWWVYSKRGQAHATVDRKIVHSGKQSMRLSGTPDARFVFLSPKLQVSAGDEIAFSGWLRCDTTQDTNRAGLVVMFRDRDGKIVDRSTVMPSALNANEWVLLRGTAKAPPHAAVADFDVSCSNLVGQVWADDVSAVITSPQSVYLETEPKPWVGKHEVTVRVLNRAGSMFSGAVRIETTGKPVTVPITIAPRASQKVRVPVTLLEPGSHYYSLELLDQSGNRQRTLDGHFHISEPLTVFPACPAYLKIEKGTSDVRVDAHIVMNPANRAGLRLQAILKDNAGSQIAQNTVDASRGEFVGTKLRVPNSQPGFYKISVHLLGRQGEIASDNTDVHVDNGADAIVKTDANGFLRVAGEPEFPIGLYSTSRYEELVAGGFTASHTYGVSAGEAADPINSTDIDVKRLLDANVKNHLRMMVELPRHAIEKAQWAQVRRRIETFRNHPGLLCWGSEERVARGEAPLKNIQTLYKIVHELDPNHPLVLGDSRDIIQHLMGDRRNFFEDNAMDAGIWWWYPIPLDGDDGGLLNGQDKAAKILEPPSWLTTTTSKKPLWIAIQSYQHPKKDARFPTPAEYRCMSYLSIINHARGLWFYTGSGQKDFYGKPAGLLNKPEEAHWDYVKQLVHELRELSPVIMSPLASGVTLSPANPMIEFSVHQLNNKMYVFAANKSSQVQNARFTSPAFSNKRVKVLHEDHNATINGDGIDDTFSPFGVHVYCIEQADSSSTGG